MFKKRKKVQINYKSGVKQIVVVEELKSKTIDGSISELEWKKMKPTPLCIGINDIESIWIL